MAAHQKLNNLTVLLDHNQVQALGDSASIFALKHLPSTLTGMGWDVFTQDGHNLEKMTLKTRLTHQPRFFIFSTQKNHGLENIFSPLEAHYKGPPNAGLS